jgi:general secretion pathway protein G
VFDSGSKVGSTAFHRAIWSVGVIALGVLGFVLLYAILEKISPTALDAHPGFSSRKKTEADIRAIGSALEEYGIANGGRFPDSLRPLVTPDANNRTFLNARFVPKDAWGHDYIYSPPGPGQPQPNVTSYGKDGQPGGNEDDADIDLLSLEGVRG